MRFPRGEIALNLDRDRPLLRLIWQAEIATSRQLFELRRLAERRLERSYDAFSNRLRRLVENDFLSKQSIYAPAITKGYKITSKGISQLRDWGELPHDLSGGSAMTPIPECIYLNAIRIKFWNQQAENGWVSRRELVSHDQYFQLANGNPELSAWVNLDGKSGFARLGIIYTVPTRSLPDYRCLLAKWASVRSVNWIICIVPSEQEALWLAKQLHPCAIQVILTSRDEFQAKTLDCRAYLLGTVQPVPLRKLILENQQLLLDFPIDASHCSGECILNPGNVGSFGENWPTVS